MSLMKRRAPSSAQRLAVAKPIPAPAAAVMSTFFPRSRSWAGTYGGGGTLDMEFLLALARFARQAENALGDDVTLDLIRTPVNGVRTRKEKHPL